ncbi:MAG: ammonia channel protein [Omnitrophica WOR_2 bacterium GWF2_38_59]|nr:MAG: ammonia channel protein [Omnitrophica WOR_2 bacterium GWA2_37_7]OGX21984.1 MAG: ammonia channel protein [Omnitrophica WOR_2 bacterium GWF2_38_59]OGX50250.1 MAG: ammonia channel protein [Omnitrophica WOR_2 bacterium RIFOXYA2_FULL_38_17]OGX54060.1 MAG: ammonia channel protein [Omnitrophica WOR_2 bacterium RIFOXYA12_FULL_38_10]OGX56741.1 MAG: ammonia channel protein [Omnitrophica WOR_2 bacterium RIFOXYB2_FULL_38_16]OGX57266.1 MAG: ammonia channel protein [Omnitrophica WOR_2 bacterium RIFO
MKLFRMLGSLITAAAVSLFYAVSCFAGENGVIDSGATAWMLTSTALVLLMVPGLAMFYGGLVRTKNVLGTMMHSFVSIAIIGVLWTIFGYSLSFGHSILGGFLGWNPDYFFLKGIDESIVNGVPEYVLAMFQGKFAIITPALIAGALAERVYFRGYCLFIALWFLFVYCPLAHWVWASDGWLFNAGARGVIDLAGGTVIHVSAGVSALVVSLFLGKRKGYPETVVMPNNLVMTMIGAGLLWVGWFGFNAGSTVHSGLDTARALTMTQISASSGAVTWLVLEAIIFKKATSLGFVSGILAGLVVITPAAGVVLPSGALILGMLSSIACYFALKMKAKFGYDDSLDCFGIHGVGSGLGVLMLSFFIRGSWMAEASAAIGTRWTNVDQFFIQLKGLSATIVLAALGTLIISFVVENTIGFRLGKAKEMAGMDHSLHGEHGYGMLNVN